MAVVVFLRGVNVGGHRTFQPAALALARDLAAFDVVNIGAAGSFVIRKAVAQATRLLSQGLRRRRRRVWDVPFASSGPDNRPGD